MTSMAVSNTTPIIYLVKNGRLEILRDVYNVIYICSPVWQDISYLQARGLLSREEIFSIAEARQEKWSVLRDPKEKVSIGMKDDLVDRSLGLGEAYSIALAKELKTIFLANDKQAIETAKEYGIGTRWFTQILHDALRKNYVGNIDEYTQILDSCINNGLYFNKKQRDKAIEEARATK